MRSAFAFARRLVREALLLSHVELIYMLAQCSTLPDIGVDFHDRRFSRRKEYITTTTMGGGAGMDGGIVVYSLTTRGSELGRAMTLRMTTMALASSRPPT